MATKKGDHVPYRDEPDRDDAASTSSAVLLGDFDSFPDEALPAYEDTPSQPPASSAEVVPTRRGIFYDGLYVVSRSIQKEIQLTCSRTPPDLPFSSHGLGKQEIRTRFPNYSTDSEKLETMIRHQANHPPCYTVQLHGSHTETRRNGNKETKDKVDDFLIIINISNLLTPGLGVGGKLELLPDNKRGFRGTRFPSLEPCVSDVEATDELKGRILQCSYPG